MNLSRRDRREWRIIFWLGLASVLISAYFGYHRSSDSPASGSLTGIATRSHRHADHAVRSQGRAPCASAAPAAPAAVIGYFAFRVVFYIVVIIGGLLVIGSPAVRAASRSTIDLPRVDRSSPIAMSVFANLAFEMGSLLGFGTLRNLLTGRYVQPRTGAEEHFC